MTNRRKQQFIAALIAGTVITTGSQAKEPHPFNFKGFSLEKTTFSAANHTLYCKSPTDGTVVGRRFDNELALSLIQQLVSPNLAESGLISPTGGIQSAIKFIESEEFSNFDWELANIDEFGEKIDTSDAFKAKQAQAKQLRQLAEGYLRWMVKMGETKQYPFSTTVDRKKIAELRKSLHIDKLRAKVDNTFKEQKEVKVRKKKRLTHEELELKALKERTLEEAKPLLLELLRSTSKAPLFECVEEQKTFTEANPFFQGLRLRKTPADLLKSNKPEGALIGFTRNRSINDVDTDGDEVNDDTVKQVNTSLSIEATLGYKFEIPFVETESVLYVQYSLNDSDERFDGINTTNIINMGDDDRRETVAFGLTGKYRELPLIRSISFLKARKLNIEYATYDFAYIRSLNFDSEAFRFRLTNDHRVCLNKDNLCWGAKEKDKFGDSFKGDKIGNVTINSIFQTVAEVSVIDDAGTNPDFLKFKPADDDTTPPEVIDGASEYIGFGAKIGAALEWKKLTLAAAYRYLAIPTSRVNDQSIFTASADLTLLESDTHTTTIGIEYRNGDDENSFQDVDETKINFKIKF